MGAIIELESFRAKGEVARKEKYGQVLSGSFKVLNSSINDVVGNSIFASLMMVAIMSEYGNRNSLCEDLPEDLQFEIGESLRFLKDVWLVRLRKDISDFERLLRRFMTGRKAARYRARLRESHGPNR